MNIGVEFVPNKRLVIGVELVPNKKESWEAVEGGSTMHLLGNLERKKQGSVQG